MHAPRQRPSKRSNEATAISELVEQGVHVGFGLFEGAFMGWSF